MRKNGSIKWKEGWGQTGGMGEGNASRGSVKFSPNAYTKKMPLKIPKADWNKVHDFTKAIAKQMEDDDPDRYISQSGKAKR